MIERCLLSTVSGKNIDDRGSRGGEHYGKVYDCCGWNRICRFVYRNSTIPASYECGIIGTSQGEPSELPQN